MYSRQKNSLYFGLLALVFSASVQANIVLHGTRIIYPEGEKEVTLRMENKGTEPSLVQAWIDKGNSKEKVSKIDVPFVILPPVARIEANQGQTLRISYTGSNLPSDKESVFWLNTLDIPPVAAGAGASGNVLQMAFRARIKLFYRPASLSDQRYSEAVSRLTWHQGNCSGHRCIQIKNASGFHITITKVSDKSSILTPAGEDGKMISPFSSETFSVTREPAGSDVVVTYINDYGGAVKETIKQG